MCNVIMRTRTLDRVESVVRAPVRRAELGMTPQEILCSNEIVNTRYKSNSILNSLVPSGEVYSNIVGMDLVMLTRDDGQLYIDEVTVIGARGDYYIVKFKEDGLCYSVLKSRVLFARY